MDNGVLIAWIYGAIYLTTEFVVWLVQRRRQSSITTQSMALLRSFTALVFVLLLGIFYDPVWAIAATGFFTVVAMLYLLMTFIQKQSERYNN